MTTVTLPIAEYLPDMPDFPASGSSSIRNVYPRTPMSYGAINAPAIVYDALAKRCQGGCAYRDSGGGTHLFAGDANDLYTVVASDATWQNVSKSAGVYNVDPEEEWEFAYFNGDLVATNFADNPQVFTLASSVAFADLMGGPPRARYVTVVKNAFVAFGNTYDTSNGNMPQRVWWSATGNHKNWPVLGSAAAAQVQSGAVDLLGDGGWIKGFASDLVNADAVVFQEYEVKQMIYAGPPTIFNFIPVEAARGTPAPYSIVPTGGIAYYLGQDGFYAFDGSASRPIGANRVDKTFFAAVQDLSRVVGAADPLNRLVWWAYPGPGSVAGNPTEILIYNWHLDRWAIADVSCETIMRLLSVGYTLDQLYTVLGYTLDNLPAPLDSPIWQGGRLNLGIFDTNHKLNFFTGTPLAATVESSETQAIPGRRALITNSRPLVDGVGSTASVSIGHRERQQDAVSYGGAVALNSMGTCPQRVSGRYLRAKTTIASGSTTWTNVSGVEIDYVGQGTR